MDTSSILTRLVETIDRHDWAHLADLLHAEFSSRLVHTGEVLDRATWVRLNAEYPGFERMHLEDLLANGDRGVARCRVSGSVDGRAEVFQVAMFVSVKDGLIVEMVEVWADVDVSPPTGRRPSDA